MSLRLEMLQVARLAPRLLLDSSDLVRDFLLGQLSAEAGFLDRDGKPDLYYTVFGIEGLLALRVDPPASRLSRYLEAFEDGGGLDLVHLAALARCLADLGLTEAGGRREALRARLEAFRSPDGGYHNQTGAAAGTVYGCFLALGAYQDLGADLPAADRLGGFLRGMESADGGYANEPGAPAGSLPATAAAVSILRNLGLPSPPAAGEWLERQRRKDGGFVATPRTPLPDLLSTAIALHALAGLGRPLDEIKGPCLDFIDSLWTNRGSFHGTWADDVLDCEYTYYGLLALGHLSL